MAYTLYDGTILVTQSLLKTLLHILQKAEASSSTTTTTLLLARLHAEMYPLPDQIRLATQFSENLCARLCGREPQTFTEPLTSFAEFYSRIETVLKILGEAEKDFVNGNGDVLQSTPMGPGKVADVSAAMYAHSIALPNIYFHVGTAYAILRKEGVELGKLDYYSGFLPQLPKTEDSK